MSIEKAMDAMASDIGASLARLIAYRMERIPRQPAGFKVMRFTGSEIHRDLMQCVHDLHYACWHFYEAPSAE